ncbi:soluble pyridine nucleotide transhydrogenase [Striga asiatica]|uniref:Soluble pyridine nucleotide transhydrogenase n=1 Tax=Striga asiatica TaxID=4170 RepID=A0A5A7PSY2_STRAF|nr:soluble pyridine nucleotide transhydrogenase [Striga asiatica]
MRAASTTGRVIKDGSGSFSVRISVVFGSAVFGFSSKFHPRFCGFGYPKVFDFGSIRSEPEPLPSLRVMNLCHEPRTGPNESRVASTAGLTSWTSDWAQQFEGFIYWAASGPRVGPNDLKSILGHQRLQNAVYDSRLPKVIFLFEFRGVLDLRELPKVIFLFEFRGVLDLGELRSYRAMVFVGPVDGLELASIELMNRRSMVGISFFSSQPRDGSGLHLSKVRLEYELWCQIRNLGLCL